MYLSIMPGPESEYTINRKHLEQEGERKVAELIHENAVTEEALMDIINEGNDAFKSVHGRNMTYAEMRSMYG
jgi:hypothetical protein